jgi:signal transduction histidine kinase
VNDSFMVAPGGATAVASAEGAAFGMAVALAVAGAALAALGAWTFLSLRRRVADAERQAAEAARNAEIASMTRGLAHEIKNPLSTVALNAQLLREEILDSPLAEADRAGMTRRVDTLAREAARLRDILSDFLRYAGRLQLDRRECDLREVAGEIADFFMPQAEQAGVRFVVQPDASPVRAEVDPALLKQAVLNLLLNGVQAMQDLPQDRARTLSLSVSRGEPRGPRGTPTAAVEVADSGPGIPEADREAVFEPYRTTKPGGNGLGLATTRRIVEAHGGSVQALEAPGGGARFRITLPATPASPSA